MSGLGEWQAFIKAEDLAYARQLELELTRIAAHKHAFGRAPTRDRYLDAIAAYTESPSEKNLSSLKAHVVEMTLVDLTTSLPFYSTARTLVCKASAKFFRAQFVPWARDLIERGLAQARKNLDSVVAIEEQHHREITGRTLDGKPNAIITEARRPVAEMEDILATLNGSQIVASEEHRVSAFVKLIERKAEGKKKSQ